jgi:hypothetical protein
MDLRTEPYLEQQARWPPAGKAILAQFDDTSVVVYQAYRPEIGRFAAEHGYFGGAFSVDRMTWIKPNFLWMMHRSGWGTKPGQEVVLAVRIQRDAWDSILASAVHSSFAASPIADHETWKRALRDSDVRLQWDPDHGPRGQKLARRAIQLGLRGESTRLYSREWIISIQDISPFVATQRAHVRAGDDRSLMTPTESVYPLPTGV